jgi:hypothetical protein
VSHFACRRLAIFSAVLLAAACAAGSGTGTGSVTGGTGGSTGSSSGSTAQATGGGHPGVGGSVYFDAGNPDALPDPDAACGLITVDATTTPLDLYIALDKSSSMAGTKWDGAKAGLQAFLTDPASTGIRVALNFFPIDGNPTCDQFAYEPPVVPFDFLPANATTISTAIGAATPDGFSTPIYPALGGAILAGIQIAQNNAGDAAAVLLVTDGEPDGPATTCGSVNPDDPTAIASLASAGLAYDPSVKTFVIGLPGVNQTVANQIAAAGGTTSAILVTTTNVQAEFQAALAQVRGQALPCQYDLPTQVAGGAVDSGHVNVEETLGTSPTAILPQDAACTGGAGWYYDNPTQPTHIELCAASCTALRTAASAKVQILLGCQTETK